MNRIHNLLCRSAWWRRTAREQLLFAEACRVLRPGGVFAGSDSLPSLAFRLLHIADTMVALDPRTLPHRLKAAGFATVDTRTVKRTVRFRAYR